MHTSGVCLLIKREFRHLCGPIRESFKQGRVCKEYLCLVDTGGQALSDEFYVDAPVQRHPSIGIMREIGETEADAKPAYTTFQVLANAERNAIALLRALPRTGR
jgi:23S rRNA-/tRNA-specific pseudouridylate synthase